MKVAILGSTNSRNAGGIYNIAYMFGHSLSAINKTDVQFFMHDDEYSAEDKLSYAPLPMHSYTVKGLKKLGYTTDLYGLLDKFKPDVIHTLGIWLYFSAVNKKYSSKTNTPYVIAPQGMLDPWQLKQSFSKDLKKKIALTLYERANLNHATCIQALCKSEYESIRAFGLKNPVAIIPNAIDLPEITSRNNYDTVPYRWDVCKGRKTLLFLSRIHAKKGLDNLLQGWALTKPASHNWQLVIAGETKDTEYMQSLVDATKKYGITETVQFIGGQFGENKKTCFIDADAFILPSFSEGLPMAVLEAWSYNLPSLLTSFCNLPEGFTENAAMQIEPTAESIAAGINKMASMDETTLSAMAKNGYKLVEEKFNWQAVAKSSVQLYEWMRGKAEKPAFVFND